MKLVPDKFRESHSDLVYALVRRRSRAFVVTEKPTLVIAPHPDDETLGCGGLIALKRLRKTPVHILFLTAGEKGPGPESSLTTLRRAEALAALAHLGLTENDATFWTYPDAQLAELPATEQFALTQRLANLLEQLRIEEVFVTHRADAHEDHETAFRALRAATKNNPITLWQYPIWLAWSKPLLMRLRPSFLKNAFTLDIAAVRERKKLALAAYASQVAAFPAGFLNRFETPYEVFFATGDTH